MELNKSNKHIYALTFGMLNILPMAQKIIKKRMSLNHKQYKSSIRDNGDMSLHRITVGDQRPTVSDIMDSPFG